MRNKKAYTDKEIQKLIKAGLRADDRLDVHQKEAVLELLLKKTTQPGKEYQPTPVSVIALSALWIGVAVMVLAGIPDSIYVIDLIKEALGLSMLLIPVSGIVLIILKMKSHEKSIV